MQAPIPTGVALQLFALLAVATTTVGRATRIADDTFFTDGKQVYYSMNSTKQLVPPMLGCGVCHCKHVVYLSPEDVAKFPVNSHYPNYYCGQSTVPAPTVVDISEVRAKDTVRRMFLVDVVLFCTLFGAWLCFLKPFRKDIQTRYIETDSEVSDDDAFEGSEKYLSPIAQAALRALQDSHMLHRGVCWNLSYGKVIDEVLQTPPKSHWGDWGSIEDNCYHHSDYFLEQFYEHMMQAEEWLDLTSLSPPQQRFETMIQRALRDLNKKATRQGSSITCRFLFGNLPGMPIDVTSLCRTFTSRIEGYPHLEVWVGAWRKMVSWNHSKIIAIDGEKLITGGHNLFDGHYLRADPVHDLTMKADGKVARDGHNFANKQWSYLIETDNNYRIMKVWPDFLPAPSDDRVMVSNWPRSATTYPPMYKSYETMLSLEQAVAEGNSPMISAGRCGSLHQNEAQQNPSDSAFQAMFESAQKSIKMSLQDLGPVAMTVAGSTVPVPGAGGEWPDGYLTAIARAVMERNVIVRIVVSYPRSIPNDLSFTEALYGNGWNCNDLAAQIVKRMMAVAPDESTEEIRSALIARVHVCFVRVGREQDRYSSGTTVGNHSKFFMIDDQTYYIGSQNLYVCNLAEWGLIIDDNRAAQRILDDFWDPLWENSYRITDVSPDEVMRIVGLKVGSRPIGELTEEEHEEVASALARMGQLNVNRSSVICFVDTAYRCNLGPRAMVCVRIENLAGKVVGRPHFTDPAEVWGKRPSWKDMLPFQDLKSPSQCVLKAVVYDDESLDDFGEEITSNLEAADDTFGVGKVMLDQLANSTKFTIFKVKIKGGRFRGAKLKLGLSTNGTWGRKTIS